MKMTYKVNRVIEVIDGDTVDCLIDLGFYVMIRTRIRMIGIDAPEIKGKTKALGEASRAWLAAALDRHKASLVVETTKADKYGRLLGHFKCSAGSINDAMIANGHAQFYQL